MTAESIPGALPPTGPLDAWVERFAALPAGVRITAEPFVAMVDLRGDPGPGLPGPNTWAAHGDGRVIWLGPDEWLVTSPSRTPAQLAAEWDGSTVDVSGQRTTVRIGGPDARELLATGCALDLHPRAFPPGSAAQTLLGLAGVVLLGLEDGYELLVRSSFARYLADWLVDAAVELG